MGLPYFPDHKARLLARLRSQDREQPTFRAWYTGLAAGLQEAEDTLFGLQQGLDLPTATGAALETWAELLGEQRAGLTDNELRRIVAVKLQVMRAICTTGEQIVIYRTLLQASHVRLFPLWPASYQIQGIGVTELRPVLRRRVSRMMQSIVPAGVKGHVIEARPGYFGFAGDPLAQGFGVGVLSRLLF